MPLTYSLSPGGTSYSLVYNSCVAGHAEIPSIYNGLPVTSIGPGAFYACQNLTSVTIPNSITHIGDSAFYFTNLNEINVPESITNLPYEFCLSCANLTGVSLPNSLTGIGASAFGATALTNITIPQNVTNIGYSAFGGTPLNNIYFLGNMPNFSNDIFLNVNSNLKINRIPGKNWNTYFIQGRPVELFYPKDYIIKNQIKSGGNGKTIIRGDRDAINYIRRVEAADGQPLEPRVILAIYNFVTGCKNDGIWDAIKTSCILSGARTLSGALIPLKGIAPTNFNFLSSDYSRANGLQGNASNKYLNPNRTSNADPENSIHRAFYVTSTSANNAGFIYGNSDTCTTTDGESLRWLSLQWAINFRSIGGSTVTTNSHNGFIGLSSDNNSTYTYRNNSTVQTRPRGGLSPKNNNMFIYAINYRDNCVAGFRAIGYSNVRISFYSLGENLNLSLLNARLNTLMSVYSTLT